MALNKGIRDPKLRGTNIKGTNFKSLNQQNFLPLQSGTVLGMCGFTMVGGGFIPQNKTLNPKFRSLQLIFALGSLKSEP